MKVFMVFFIFACFAFPVFSQSQNTPNPDMDRFNALSESMDSSVTRSTGILAGYDSMTNNDGEYKMYASYKKRYDDLVKALRESEAKMGLLVRTHDHANNVKNERDTYDDLLNQLQAVKTEYDGWLRTVQ